jgi:cell division protein FtsZ
VIREAADTGDLQLNFGVISNEAMGDSVKVTVIATGFAKPEEKEVRRESVIEPRPVSEFFAERPGEPSNIPAMREPVAEPLPVAAAPVFGEELDVPAYLRQGKLLN